MDNLHRWQLIARDHHTQKFKCRVCHAVKVRVSYSDRFPQTRYVRRDGAVFRDRACACIPLEMEIPA